MKTNFTLCLLFATALCVLSPESASGQCPAGYTSAQLNWDNIEFLPSNNTRYTTYYPSSSFPYSQNFALGTRRLNMVMAPQANITLNGENGTNTAHTGSYAAAGDDVQFTTTSTSATTITLTFDLEVANVRFALFDLDNSQRVTIAATNEISAAQVITCVLSNGSSGTTITGSGTTSVVATAPATAYASNDTRSVINVGINGPVQTITLSFSNATGDIWLSDIDACVTGSFPTGYQIVSRPFTGQPQYVLAVVNNNIYYIDPTNGKSYFLFNEPGHDRLNSMAYDPYRRVVYYTYSLTDRVGLNPQVDKTVKKYSVDSKTISVLIPDVNTFGIPTYESGVESGAATFYNGSLYLGIEGYTGANYAASRKSTIWKIDFDAAGNPVAPATQVWGVLADDGTNAQNIHDWSDFTITDGDLVDFNGSASGQIDFSHTNMMTGVRTKYTPSGVTPKQVSIGWDEKIYNVDASISLYNGTNGVGTAFTMTAPLGPTIPTGTSASWGDAAGPYRPFLDFGDAPATYDPVALSPACHDTLTPTVSGARTRMRLGPNEDVEWLKKGLTSVEDSYEDGLSFVPIFSPASGYLAQVTVFNNSGVNATLCAWLDYNANGTFDASEAITPITVSSSGSNQSFWLNWASTPSTLTTGQYTYLRIRITAASYGMSASTPTGYYDMGEVEDYKVIVDNSVLAIPLLSFEAQTEKNKQVELDWSINEEPDFLGYTAERSRDGENWEAIGFYPAGGAEGLQVYSLTDSDPYPGTSFYRLKLNQGSKPVRYSNVKSVKLKDLTSLIELYPNPATSQAVVRLDGDFSEQVASLSLTDARGTVVFRKQVVMVSGRNSILIPIDPTWSPGIYYLQVTAGSQQTTRSLVIGKK